MLKSSSVSARSNDNEMACVGDNALTVATHTVEHKKKYIVMCRTAVSCINIMIIVIIILTGHSVSQSQIINYVVDKFNVLVKDGCPQFTNFCKIETRCEYIHELRAFSTERTWEHDDDSSCFSSLFLYCCVDFHYSGLM